MVFQQDGQLLQNNQQILILMGWLNNHPIFYIYNKVSKEGIIMRKITKLVLHCSATPEGKNFTVADIDKWHKQRGFRKIGYHYVIYIDGSVHKGRNDDEIGAHCTGHNSDSVGVCYIGGMDSTNKFAKDTRTSAQKKALLKLVKELMNKYSIDVNNIHCHNEFAKKSCPCFKIEDFRKELSDDE